MSTTKNQQQFIKSVVIGAQQGWATHKILPSLTIAQSILESGWGTSGLAVRANNLFGIKAIGGWTGQSILFPTSEYENNQWIHIEARFRKYPNRAASILDHALFLTKNSRYNALHGVSDYVKATELIHQEGYATDPNYPALLQSIIKQFELNKYDPNPVKYTRVLHLVNPAMKGDDIKAVQHHMMMKVSGMYDTTTFNAVKHFQKVYGLTVDGVVGQQTWHKMFG